MSEIEITPENIDAMALRAKSDRHVAAAIHTWAYDNADDARDALLTSEAFREYAQDHYRMAWLGEVPGDA